MSPIHRLSGLEDIMKRTLSGQLHFGWAQFAIVFTVFLVLLLLISVLFVPL
jgi:hypothetical protein